MDCSSEVDGTRLDASALVDINSDVKLYAGRFDGGAQRADLQLAPGRLAYVHVARGELTVNGTRLKAGDALQLVPDNGQPVALALADGDKAEVLLFDLGQPH